MEQGKRHASLLRLLDRPAGLPCPPAMPVTPPDTPSASPSLPAPAKHPQPLSEGAPQEQSQASAKSRTSPPASPSPASAAGTTNAHGYLPYHNHLRHHDSRPHEAPHHYASPHPERTSQQHQGHLEASPHHASHLQAQDDRNDDGQQRSLSSASTSQEGNRQSPKSPQTDPFLQGNYASLSAAVCHRQPVESNRPLLQTNSESLGSLSDSLSPPGTQTGNFLNVGTPGHPLGVPTTTAGSDVTSDSGIRRSVMVEAVKMLNMYITVWIKILLLSFTLRTFTGCLFQHIWYMIYTCTSSNLNLYI